MENKNEKNILTFLKNDYCSASFLLASLINLAAASFLLNLISLIVALIFLNPMNISKNKKPNTDMDMSIDIIGFNMIAIISHQFQKRRSILKYFVASRLNI